MAPTRTYTPVTKEARARIERDAQELSQQALSGFAERVMRRLEGSPRFQSIGRKKYVYVDDVSQIIDEELHRVDAS